MKMKHAKKKEEKHKEEGEEEGRRRGGERKVKMTVVVFIEEEEEESFIMVKKRFGNKKLPSPSPNSSCQQEGASPPVVTNRGLAQSSWPSILFSSTSWPLPLQIEARGLFTTSSSSSSLWTCRSKCGQLDSSIVFVFFVVDLLDPCLCLVVPPLPVVEFCSFLAACFALPSKSD
ncbi:uncharacterized protein DS421_16g553340 [Arachis hypogaea]|nr:uncharacterized protein DS421_16g553340 [Arachis hypogaea]